MMRMLLFRFSVVVFSALMLFLSILGCTLFYVEHRFLCFPLAFTAKKGEN